MNTAERASSPAPGFRLPLALRRFFRTEQTGAAILLAAAVVAMVWANSPWRASYEALWGSHVGAQVGEIRLQSDLRHLVNEGLMTLFFFVVGLEIKRELVAGELQSWRRAALPAVAAVGGMVAPAGLYLVLNVGQPGVTGWGVPIATDIAFAVGVLALAGPAVPSSLKVFLLSLAIVDDIGAILVIAVFYAGSIDVVSLAVAAGLLALVVLVRQAGVVWMPVYVLLGTGVWFAVYQSGVHATITGAVLGLMAPARPLAAGAVARQWSSDLSDEPRPAELQTMTRLARATVSEAERLQHALHPAVSFVVLPLFALANAGVSLGGDTFAARGAEPVVLGVVVGLILGKVLGIAGVSWMATRAGLTTLPEGVTWAHVLGMALTAGIGFTVSLFIAELALEPALAQAAKLGILVASALASVLGLIVLRRVSASRAGPAA